MIAEYAGVKVAGHHKSAEKNPGLIFLCRAYYPQGSMKKQLRSDQVLAISKRKSLPEYSFFSALPQVTLTAIPINPR